MLLRDAIELYMKDLTGMIADQTRRTYERGLKEFLLFVGNKEIKEVSRRDLVNWRTYLQTRPRYVDHDGTPTSKDTLSVFTVRKLLSTVRTFFIWAYDDRVIERNPFRKFKLPPKPDLEPKAISLGEFHRLVLAAADYEGTHLDMESAYVARNTAILYFLASTGCRSGGMLGLKMEHLFEKHAVVREKSRGGGKQRVVFLSLSAQEAMKTWLNERKRFVKSEYVFVSLEGKTKGKHMSHKALSDALKRLTKRAYIDRNVTAHMFRHTSAREWLRRGMTLEQVSQMLGHTDIRTTKENYARWSKAELEEYHKMSTWV